MAAPTWLSDAVFYQVYPQSFADSNGDGIGDLPGIAEHLDYLAWLGVTAVWLNPCFVSPMRDAGYDVADYLTIAPRYGDNDDLAELVDQARARGIRLLLDLVPGHTSDTAPVVRGVRRTTRTTTATSGPAPARRPPAGAVRPLSRHPPGRLPAELLRLPARAELRLRPPAGGRALAAGRGGRGPAGQPCGAARDRGPLATARRVRIPRRHGLLAGERRPRPYRNLPAVARATRLARPRAPRRGPAVRVGRPGSGRARGVPRRLLPPFRRPGRRQAAALAVEQRHLDRTPGMGHGAVLLRRRGRG